MDTCICMAESLRCSPKTTTTLFIGYACMRAKSLQSCLTVTLWMQPARLLCTWNFSGKNTGVDCHSLLQGIFPTHISYVSCIGRWILYHQRPLGSPYLLIEPKISVLRPKAVKTRVVQKLTFQHFILFENNLDSQ